MNYKATVYEILGFYIDECLDWKKHCETVISNMSLTHYILENFRSVYHTRSDDDVLLCSGEITFVVLCIILVGVLQIQRCFHFIKDKIRCMAEILTLLIRYILDFCVFVFDDMKNFIVRYIVSIEDSVKIFKNLFQLPAVEKTCFVVIEK